MIDGPMRRVLPRYTDRLIRTYQCLGLHPNHITLLALGIAVVSALAVAADYPWLAIAVWWGGRLLDGTDGIYARQTGQTTHLGAYLDIVCDMAAYSVMIVAFASRHPNLSTAWMLILVGYVLCITSALALGGLERELALDQNDNRGVRLGAGLAEAGETGIAYTVFLLLPGHITITAHIWLAILAITVFTRTLLAYRLLTPIDRNSGS